MRRKSTSFEAKNEGPHPQTSEPTFADCLKTPIKMPKGKNSSNSEPASRFSSVPNGCGPDAAHR